MGVLQLELEAMARLSLLGEYAIGENIIKEPGSRL